VNKFDTLDKMDKLIQEDVETIKNHLVKEKRTKQQKLPLGDAATHQMVLSQLKRKKTKRETTSPFSRFRLAVARFWSTGLRVNRLRR